MATVGQILPAANTNVAPRRSVAHGRLSASLAKAPRADDVYYLDDDPSFARRFNSFAKTRSA
jgi:hypothetical protein